jgi:hypothetical protein
MHSSKISITQCSTVRSPPKYSLKGRERERSADESAPGPGKYGVPNIDEKFRRSCSFSFGSSSRLGDKKWAGLPGPGTYTAVDPNAQGPMFGFGSAARIPKAKERKTPDPGEYKIFKPLASGQITLAGKRTGQKFLHSVPGPGSYDPDFKPTQPALPVPLLNMGEEKSLTFKVRSETPAPGTYPALKELGGNITTQSSPSFSMYGRRKPPPADTTPGPTYPHYTQF